MPIPLTTPFTNPIAPISESAVGATHFDIYGSGGYRSVTTSGTGTLSEQLNAQVTVQRRRVGMLAYDTRTDAYYRLTQLDPGVWAVEDFGGSGSVVSVAMTVPSGLAVDGSPVLDDGTLAVSIDSNVLSDGLVRVSGTGFANATAGTHYAAASHTHATSDIAGVANGRLIGRSSAGSGAAEQITVSTGLTLNGGVLTAQGSGGTVTNIAGDGVAILTNTDDLGVSFTIAHDTSGVTPGTYGGPGTVAKVTVDARGHVTDVQQETITGFLSTSGGTVTGPVILSGGTASLTVGGDISIGGNLTVEGSQTIVNTETVLVEDKNIELGVGATTDAAADGGGITLRGLTNKTLNWSNATDAWTSSENLALAVNKEFLIDGVSVLTKTGLGTTVTQSRLTKVDTITDGTWQGTAVGLAYGGTGADLSSFAQGTIFMKGAGSALVAATAGTDYLDTTSTIDGGGY